MTTNDCTTKKCLKCEQQLSLDSFCKDKNRRDGLNPICKMCMKVYLAAYYSKNKIVVNKKVADYKRKHPEVAKKSYDKHKDKYNAKQRADTEGKKRDNARRRERYATDPEYRARVLEVCKESIERNHEKVVLRKRIANARNPYPNRERVKKWAENNKPRYRENSKRGYMRYRTRKHNLPFAFNEQDWNKCLEYWDYKCAVCGKTADFWTMLAADHWVALSNKSSDNPGTVPGNIIPLCHAKKGGVDSCNPRKLNRDGEWWVMNVYGKRKGNAIVKRINAYFKWIKDNNGL